MVELLLDVLCNLIKFTIHFNLSRVLPLLILPNGFNANLQHCHFGTLSHMKSNRASYSSITAISPSSEDIVSPHANAQHILESRHNAEGPCMLLWRCWLDKSGLSKHV